MNVSTIKDVAHKAGVSVATVSRVINNSDYVSEKLRDKVNNAILALGYYPNSMAVSLKKDVSYTIGFVVSDISNAYFISIARAIETEIPQYNLIMCSTEDKGTREALLIRMLLGKKMDALVINTSGENDGLIANLSHKVPVVLLHRQVAHESFVGDLIRSNDLYGGYTLTSHLILHGHKSIGVINGKLGVSTGCDRFEGYKNAMSEAGIPVYMPHTYEGDFTIEAGYYGAMALMGANTPPTAIVAMNNEMTIGSLKYCREQGIRIPQDLSLVGYGSIINAELMYVQPTIITLNPEIIGKRIAELLISRIHNQAIPNREVEYISELVAGETVRKLEDEGV